MLKFCNLNVRLKHYILILSLSTILYLNSLYADFTYDDNRAILNNQDLHSQTSWLNLFKNDFWGTSIRSSNSHGSYRPITVFSFRLNYMIHGDTPFGFHLVNLLLHLIVTLLYTILIEKFLNHRKRITTIASLLFASHPIHVESVTSIVGRADVFAAFFYLLALNFYVKFIESHSRTNPNNVYLYCTLIAATLSMLAKEHGITCLIICIVYHLFIIHRFFPFSKNNWLKIFHQQEYSLLRKGICKILITLIVLMVFRLSLIKYRPSFSSADNPASDNPSVMVRFWTFFYLPVFNFWLLIYPRWLSFDWSMGAIPLIVSCFDIRNLFTFIFYGMLAEFARRIFNYYSLVSSRDVKSNHHRNKRTTTITCHRCESHQNIKFKAHFIDEDENNNNSSFQNLNDTNIDLNNNNPDQVDANQNVFDVDSNNNNSYPNYYKDNFQDLNDIQLIPKKTTKEIPKIKKIKSKKLSQIDCFALSLSMMIIPFLPATNLFFYIGFVVAERILYIPSFGFCFFIAICIEKFIQYSRKFAPLKYLIYLSYFLLIISFSIRTILRNIDWWSEENLYRSGISINPPKAYGNLANILSSQGKNDEAEQMYKNALKQRHNMADVHYNLGLLYQNQQRYDEAFESYQQAIRFRPRLAMAYLNMGVILSRLGDKKRAKQFYTKCSQLDNHGLKDIKNHEITRMSAFYNLGRLYFEEKDYQTALEILQRSLMQLPPYYQAHSFYNLMGEIYHKLNDTSQAEIWFNKSLKAKNDHIPTYLTYAKMLIKLNRNLEAEQLYKKAIILSPNDTSVYHHYGQFKLKNDQLIEALNIYQKALKIDTKDCDIVINVANILRELRKNEEAEKYYKIAAQLRPNDVITHSNLGAIYHLNGKLEMAKQSYLKALELKPNDNITQINMAKLDRISMNNKN